MKLSLSVFITILIAQSSAAFCSDTLVQLENERKIYMHCQGTGSPAVLLISGYPDRGDASWETSLPGKKGPTIFSAVSKFTKVCDYDRPGTIKIIDNHVIKSRSDAVPQPVTAEIQAKDLHDLVKAAKMQKPFIIVAHSAGGLIARLYALKYPKDVSGLILIDVTNAKLLKTWTKKELEVFQYSVKNGPKELHSLYKDVEILNFDESFKQLAHYQDQKLSMPAIILTAGKVPDASELVKNGTWPSYGTQEMAKSIIKGIRRASDLVAGTFVPTAKRIDVKNSGHYIQKEYPALIIKLVRTMVEQQKSIIEQRT